MIFAKHETFHIREGWLYKGMAAIKDAEYAGELPTIFLDKDAPERLGIGRNMVRALRYWMQASGLSVEGREGRYVTQRLTSFGERIWKADPYLENTASLWLIHYHLASGHALSTSWYWFFNHYVPSLFDEETMLEALASWLVVESPDRKVAERSLKKDVDCLLRTYVVGDDTRTPEDLLASPLALLGLISRVRAERGKAYRLNSASVGTIPSLALLYVLVDRQRKDRGQVAQVSLSHAAREPMNAGRIFNLTTSELIEALTYLNQRWPEWQVRFVRTAGLDQLTLPTNVAHDEILAALYQAEVAWT